MSIIVLSVETKFSFNFGRNLGIIGFLGCMESVYLILFLKNHQMVFQSSYTRVPVTPHSQQYLALFYF